MRAPPRRRSRRASPSPSATPAASSSVARGGASFSDLPESVLHSVALALPHRNVPSFASASRGTRDASVAALARTRHARLTSGTLYWLRLVRAVRAMAAVRAADRVAVCESRLPEVNFCGNWRGGTEFRLPSQEAFLPDLERLPFELLPPFVSFLDHAGREFGIAVISVRVTAQKASFWVTLPGTLSRSHGGSENPTHCVRYNFDFARRRFQIGNRCDTEPSARAVEASMRAVGESMGYAEVVRD